MSRSVKEWVAKHDDQKVPDRVRDRVFERENGMCHISGRKIAPGEPWELEHKVALILGGQHRETNLFPALVDPHKRKTAAEMKIKAKIAAVRKKHNGIERAKQKIPTRSTASKQRPDKLPVPPPKSLFKKIEVQP